MPSRIYTGPHDEVDVPALGLVVKQGEQVDVSPEDAVLLDAQPENWSKPAAPVTVKPTTKED